jgi:hypothetical protein
MGWTIGVRFPAGKGFLLLTTASTQALEPTKPPIQLVTGILSLEAKQPAREAEYSPPSSAEVINEWSCTSIPQYVIMTWCLT